jgi:Ulp1 family protease
MSRIYGKNKDIVPVKIHKVQQQTNSVDCGVFAIAFMTEFCFSGWNGKK